MKYLYAAVGFSMLAMPALAQTPDAQTPDIIKVPATGSVAATADKLEAAISKAGASVAARVDHGAAAAKAGLALDEAQLVIFGNPQIGTPVMQYDSLAGLYLPLRVLVYKDSEGQVWLAYEDPAAMLRSLEGVASDAPYIGKMRGALGALTAAAAAE